MFVLELNLIIVMKKIALLFFGFWYCFGFGQETQIPSFDKPTSINLLATPDVMAFQRYNFFPVNLYTGRINISIPIFEIKSGNINVPIALNYNSSGIKVETVPSNVGSGWELNAGGVITREIKDIDDRFKLSENYPTYDDYEGVFMGYETKELFVGFDHLNGMTSLEYSMQSSQNGIDVDKVDSSPDFYHINAPNISNKFYLKTHGDDYSTPHIDRYYDGIFLTKDGTKLISNKRHLINLPVFGFNGNEDGNPDQYYNSPGTFYLNWKKKEFLDFNISKGGLIYNFSEKNIVESRNLPVDRPLNLYLTYSEYLDYDVRVTSWNISSIFDTTTNKSVQFEYTTYQRDVVDPVLNMKTRSPLSSYQSCIYDFMNYGENIIYNTKTLIKYPKIKRIQKIIWDNGQVEFLYNMQRLDAIGENALTEIIIKDKNENIIKKYRLSYDYFISKEGCSDPDCKRLKLTNVEILNTNDDILGVYNLDYEYNTPLPRRLSLQRDFLGYYNNNGITYLLNDNFTQQGPRPQLFCYSNQGNYTFLPFNRLDMTTTNVISGYSLESNNYSLTALLNRITYPTGGYSSFEYENSSFNFFNHNYTSGIARIKKQHLNDGNGHDTFLEYSYILDNGMSSGSVNNIPTFAFPSTTNFNQLTTFDKAKSGFELTNGNFIGYSRIIERKIGNGKTEYIYSSPSMYPNQHENRYTSISNTCQNFLINNSSFPSLNYIDNDIKRGKILKKYIYNENNELIKKMEYGYQYRLYSSLNLEYPVKVYIEASPPSYEERMFFTVFANSSINIERYSLGKEFIVDFRNTNEINTNTTNLYDANYPLLKEKIINDGSNLYKTKIYYPFDSEVSSNPYISNLNTLNRINEPIKIEEYKNSTLLNTKLFNYDSFGNNIIDKKSISYSKGTGILEEGSIVDKRDVKGNILEFHTNSNIYTTYIWGYNKTQPVAKIENSRYVDLPQTELNALLNFDYTTGSESSLSTLLNNLRNALPNTTMVTTMTYKPLIGVSTITDPKGDTQYYEYDDFNRLKYVKDSAGNILKETEYHYRP